MSIVRIFTHTHTHTHVGKCASDLAPNQKAIKSLVRGKAKHDGKLREFGEQSSRPVLLFIRTPLQTPSSLASAPTQTHTVLNTPPPLFTHPSEANRQLRSNSLKAFTP